VAVATGILILIIILGTTGVVAGVAFTNPDAFDNVGGTTFTPVQSGQGDPVCCDNTFAPDDLDGDGFPNFDDSCPDEPETFNGYEDENGCPDVAPESTPGDKDGDKIPDDIDLCPDEPENFNGWQDANGCPDLAPGEADTDGDGIPDSEDDCPNTKETYNGFLDFDGCKDTAPVVPVNNDFDGDGIINSVDICPNQPENFNGYKDTDGCIDDISEQDRDGDGIKNGPDQCPDDPEDFNGYKDTDGCPDTAPTTPTNPDTDNDGFPDSIDDCPTQKETYNGYQDNDGCPDTPIVDTDGDGIPDTSDACPNEYGIPSQGGCPAPVVVVDCFNPYTGNLASCDATNEELFFEQPLYTVAQVETNYKSLRDTGDKFFMKGTYVDDEQVGISVGCAFISGTNTHYNVLGTTQYDERMGKIGVIGKHYLTGSIQTTTHGYDYNNNPITLPSANSGFIVSTPAILYGELITASNVPAGTCTSDTYDGMVFVIEEGTRYGVPLSWLGTLLDWLG